MCVDIHSPAAAFVIQQTYGGVLLHAENNDAVSGLLEGWGCDCDGAAFGTGPCGGACRGHARVGGGAGGPPPGLGARPGRTAVRVLRAGSAQDYRDTGASRARPLGEGAATVAVAGRRT